MDNRIVLVMGKASSGKTASLRNLKDPEGVLYLNYDGKGLPFKHSFKEVKVDDVAETLNYLDAVSEREDIHTVIIDTITFMMNMYETQYVVYSSNTMKAWGDYGQFYKQVLHKCKVSGKNVIVLAHEDTAFVESEGIFDVRVPIKGAVAKIGVEADFEVILASKKVPLKKLEFLNKTPLLQPESTDEVYGFKYVFQTMIDKDTVNEKMRSPMGFWKYPEEKYINNDLQLVIDKLNEYFGEPK